jgi:Heparinase II/III-like protein
MGAWNHGLKQDLELLRIGCGYPAGAFGGRALKWRLVARQQMIAAFAPNRLGPAVDAQGATNEQSTGYANFTHRLWTIAERRLAACGLRLPATITARVARMPAFIAQATQPDGNLVQIGDTYAEASGDLPGTPVEYATSKGMSGSPPAQRVAVYRAGYVFGRSGWGTTRPFGKESFYSLRFGRGRQVHGHNDHMSLTYFARGRNLIVDSGHTGYENTPTARSYARPRRITCWSCRACRSPPDSAARPGDTARVYPGRTRADRPLSGLGVPRDVAAYPGASDRDDPDGI